jgi:hypothetical protein
LSKNGAADAGLLPISVDNGMILLPIFHMTGGAIATAGVALAADNSGRPNPRAADATMTPR